jgi:hypothetical protein
VGIARGELTTHGVIFGMTGSGKTGLGVVLIEECLARGVPVLAIDPKGDLTNLGLVFPGLSADEFEPWIDAAAATASGVSPGAYAQSQSDLWREGLARWGIDESALADYVAGHDFTVYTPGSSTGRPLNVLGSLAAPHTGDHEAVAEEVEGYVSALLSLIGIEADPLSSREHILLSNIITVAWAAGEDLDLAELVALVQQPPMRRLGVFDLDQFYPPADRAALAMKLNGLLASPGFQAWMQGDPIDIGAMLRTPDGRPRCAVVTTAHLDDEQRHSATAMVLSKVVSWMRTQSGTSELRAVVYMDEVAGYLPPTAQPPTKKPAMLLLKQARAFGLGVVLATQNPVDIDYKALSNAGTWMVGRLTTQRDRARLLAGMSSALGGADTSGVAEALSGLGKRQFLLRRTDATLERFTTQWARSYLRGPLTSHQIRQLAAAAHTAAAETATPTTAGAQHPAAAASKVPSGEPAGPLADDETTVMPPVAPGIPVAHLDPAAAWAAAIGAAPTARTASRYAAAAAARVALRYDDTRAGVLHDEEYEAVVFPLPAETAQIAPVPVDYDERDLIPDAPVGVRYQLPLAAVRSAGYWTGLRRALMDHLVRNRSVTIWVNPDLKLYSRVGETSADFATRCSVAADGLADTEAAALRGKYEARLRGLRSRVAAALTKVESAEAAQRVEMVGSFGSVLGGFLGGRRSASSLGAAARRHQAAAARVDTATRRADDLAADLAHLESELADDLAGIDASAQQRAASVQQLRIPLEKTDVQVTDLRLLWVPVL